MIPNNLSQLFLRTSQKGLLLLTLFSMVVACQDDGLYPANNGVEFYPTLSDYRIYQGALADLMPSADYYPYELGSSLFTDHAEKQRLIKIPSTGQMTKTGDGLPDFPDGTIMAKTFYYYNDARDWSKGKNVIETRLLIKDADQWHVATYLWDDSQTEARLVESGYNRLVNFIDKEGQPQVIAYQLPSNRACASCHYANDQLTPIGPKLRNLNIEVAHQGGSINQLVDLQNRGLIDQFDETAIMAVPNYHDTSLPLNERARAYLDINCAHCHNAKGSSNDLDMFYSYALPFEETKIAKHKEDIVSNMIEGSMPQIGTSVIDEEGAALIEEYINSL